MTARELAIKVFSSLRSRNYIARSNFMCCQNCSCDALYQAAATRMVAPRGMVYWTKQDEHTYKHEKVLYIHFSKYADYQESIGTEIFNIINELKSSYGWDGKVEWDGDEDTAIALVDSILV